MRAIIPETVTDAMLISSTVPADDYPQWSQSATYAAEHRVMVGHRIYESAADGNIGNSPPTRPDMWVDLGVSNRWAMFDEAVGSATTADGIVKVELTPVVVTTVSVLDCDAVSIRVRILDDGATLYDETQPGQGAGGRNVVMFHDLPDVSGAIVEVTATASGSDVPVSIGSLLLGAPVDLGITEAGPSIGINDFSRRETDEFGVTTVVERAWAKRMSLRTLVQTGDVDAVQRVLASLRARACLWIGEDEYDSLAIYGFFKEFAIDVALETISYCTLTIEGLTTAGQIEGVGKSLSLIFRNSPTQPATPPSDVGFVPEGWTPGPEELVGAQFRWWSQAEFTGTTQATAWTVPVKVGGVSWEDVIDNNPLRPRPADGATVGATPEQVSAIDLLGLQVAQIDALTEELDAQAAEQQAAIIAAGGDIAALNTLTATLNSSVSSQALAISNAVGDLAELTTTVSTQQSITSTHSTAIDTLELDMASLESLVSAGSAQIATNTTAISTLTSNVATLSARVSSSNPNLLKNGSFENGMAGWTNGNVIAGHAWASTVNVWGSIGYLFKSDFLQGGGNYHYVYSDVIYLGGNGPVTLAAEFECGTAGVEAYVQVDWYNDAGTYLNSSYGPVINSPASFASAETVRAALKLTATGNTGATRCRAFLIAKVTATNVLSVNWRRAKLEMGTVMTGYSQEATVGLSMQSINGALARWALTTDVNGRLSGIENSNNGYISALRFRADLTTFESPTGGRRSEYSGGNWRAYDASGVMRSRWGVWD